MNRPKYINLTPRSSTHMWDCVEIKRDGQWATIKAERIDGVAWLTSYTRSGFISQQVELPDSAPIFTLLGEEMTDGTFWCHDCVSVDGVSMADKPQAARRMCLDAVLITWRGRFPDKSNLLRLVESYPAVEGGRLWRERVLSGDDEGLVYKKSTAAYGYPWGRMKHTVDIDYVCMGVNRSKGGKIATIKGGLWVDGELTEIAAIPGLSAGLKAELEDDGCVGRVFTATGNKLFETGRLRHPRFASWHADKPSNECIAHA